MAYTLARSLYSPLMKTFSIIIALAIGLEACLGLLAWLTFNPEGISGGVAHVTWYFHMPGYLLAESYPTTNAGAWFLIFGAGFVQSLALAALAVLIYKWRTTGQQGRSS